MAEAAENLEVTIEPEAVAPEPDVADVVAEAPAEADKTIIEPEDGIEALKEKLAAEKARGDQEAAGRQAAEEEARRHAELAARAKNDVQDANVQLVTNAVASLNQAQDALQQNYADAMVAQDFAEAAKIQREMLRNEARLNTLEAGLEQMKKAPKPSEADPVERMASNIQAQGFPRSAAWVRAHPQFATNANLAKKMFAASDLAEADGLKPDTDEYFAHVERTLGLGAAVPAAITDDNALSEAAEATQRRSAPPAAPVSRSHNGNGSTPRRITLTRAQREAAEISGLTPEEYARQLLKTQQQSLN